MALLGQISTFPTQVAPGQPVDVMLTVTNNGSSAVSLRNVEPVVTVNGSRRFPTYSMGAVPLIPGQSYVVAANITSTLTLRWQVVFHNPVPNQYGLTTTYTVGADIFDASGTLAQAGTALVTVIPKNTGQPAPSLPQTAPTVPSQPTDPSPVLPGIGQMRFDYYPNSMLVGVL